MNRPYPPLITGDLKVSDLRVTESLVVNDIDVTELTLPGSTSGSVTITAAPVTTVTQTLVLPASDAGAGTFLSNDGTGELSWIAAGGAGDVTGPGSSVDNTLVRFDGVTGKVVQDTGVVLDDSENLSGLNSMSISGSTSGAIVISAAPITTATQTLVLPAANAASGTFLSNDGTGALSWIAAGTGDVAGPGSSIDATLVRFDGVTGKVLQDSTVVLDDLENLSGLNSIGISGSTSGTTVIAAAPVTTATQTLVLPAANAGAGTFLSNDGTGALSWASGSTGDVVGPGSSTDATLVRFDGTTGKLVQSSNIVLDGSGNLSGLNSISLSGNSGTSVIAAPPVTTATQTLVLPTANAGAGTFLSNDGTGALSWVGGSTGDVVGPGSSTDTALVRFDGTTGKLVQSSNVVLDGSGNLSGLNSISLSGNSGASVIAAASTTTATQTLILPAADAGAGTFLSNDGTGALSWVSGATGNVTGPGSSVDNALVRFDGTTGKIVQGMSTPANNIIISDNGVISMPASGKIEFINGASYSSMQLRVGGINTYVENVAQGKLFMNIAGITGQSQFIVTAAGSTELLNIDLTGLCVFGGTSIGSLGFDYTKGYTRLQDTTDAGSGTGALVCSGGAYFAKNIRTKTALVLEDPDTPTNTTSIAASAVQSTASLTLTLPPTAGSSGQFLSTNGSGVTTWSNAVTTIKGSVTQTGIITDSVTTVYSSGTITTVSGSIPTDTIVSFIVNYTATETTSCVQATVSNITGSVFPIVSISGVTNGQFQVNLYNPSTITTVTLPVNIFYFMY